jgi:hypothetical protein
MMSPAAREADSRWIGELWQNYLDTVAANRQILLSRCSWRTGHAGRFDKSRW